MSSIFLVTMTGSHTRPCQWNWDNVLEGEEVDRKKATLAVSKLTQWLGLIEGGIKVFGDFGSNQQRSATTVQGITGKFAFCEAITKERKRSLPCLTSVLGSFRTRASLPVLLGTGDGDPDEPIEDAPRT